MFTCRMQQFGSCIVRFWSGPLGPQLPTEPTVWLPPADSHFISVAGGFQQISLFSGFYLSHLLTIEKLWKAIAIR